jgi:hypothetical protein
MFDPTAFDNIKVVLEGALYDMDLEGAIRITDRNDLLNTAKMSRRFELEFELAEDSLSQITAQIILEAQLTHLAAELLPGCQSEKLAGCLLYLSFYMKQAERSRDYLRIEQVVQEIWGGNREITMIEQINPLSPHPEQTTIVEIKFGRLITEDQMNDLVDMTEYMIKTLECLRPL